MPTIPIWPAVNPGEMVHWVTLLQQSASSDISGTTVRYVPFISAWAKVEWVSGADVTQSGQITTRIYPKITMRWQSGVTSNMRVSVLGETYQVQAPENPGLRNVLLILHCLGLGTNQ